MTFDPSIDNVVRLAKANKVRPKKSAAIENPVTEDAAALAFTERYRNTLRFDLDIGKWFVWMDTHWQRERTGLAFSWASVLVRELARTHPSKPRLILCKANYTGYA